MGSPNEAPLTRPSGGQGQKIAFGLSKRLWTVVAGLVGLFILSRLVGSTPEESPVGHYTARAGLLSAADFQNASLSDPPPFPFCPVFGPGDPVAERRGQVPLLKSRLHVGTGARVQRVLQKAMAGHPVTISVLGGSVSACHGAGEDPIAPRCWPARFFDWFNSVFPHPLNELTNGAARRTDSSYFAYCSGHHLPDNTDLVILEFDASDPNDPKWIDHFELLVRSILVRKEQPAVILLGHFAPQLQGQNGYAGPELLHDVVAQFYDVPHLSIKGLLYREYMLNPAGTRDTFYSDAILANPTGHEAISDVLVSYLMTQICSGWATTLGHAFDVPYMGAPDSSVTSSNLLSQDEDLEQQAGGLAAKQRAMRVPLARLADRPSDILSFREVKPFCVSANDLINPLPPNHFSGSGWKAFHPKKGADPIHYWYSDIAGSRMRVPIDISAGQVAIYYLQGPDRKLAGGADCWVDDDYEHAVELTGGAPDVDDMTATLTVINDDVSAGKHFVECMLTGGKDGAKVPEFKLLGVFAT
ncbi:hypothetical protein Q8F55_007155 [Vanrija albida]|uniref:Capsular associated protein n=1 Tax=Vanrija albida TaxID=181172 RepID=A0ABR3PZW1_9TREE